MKITAFKKALAVILSATIMTSVMSVSYISAGATEDIKNYYVPAEETETITVYFYMPDGWYNEYTDTAGVYWWEGTDACPSWEEMYSMNPTDTENIYSAEIPVDVAYIIFNNYVNGGEDPDDPKYMLAKQSQDLYILSEEVENGDSWVYFPEGTEDIGTSELYKEGLASVDGMIFVTDDSLSPYCSGSMLRTQYGEWYYYYGNGEYGYAPEKEKSAIYTGCHQVLGDVIEHKQNGVTGYVTPPATEPTTKDPNAVPLTVKATSNFFPEAIAEYNEDTKEVTVTYYLGTAKDVVTVEWWLTYNSDVLSLDPLKNLDTVSNRLNIMPQFKDSVYNIEDEGKIYGGNVGFYTYEITDDKPFVQVTFDVIGEGETTIDLNVGTLSIGDVNPDTFDVDMDSLKHYVLNYEIVEAEGIAKPTKKTELTPAGVFNTIYDINIDKYTDINDVTTLQMYIADYDINAKETKLDVDGDGIVDVRDVTALQLYLAS